MFSDNMMGEWQVAAAVANTTANADAAVAACGFESD